VSRSSDQRAAHALRKHASYPFSTPFPLSNADRHTAIQAGYPILVEVTNRTRTNRATGSFNLGGVNGSGQVPMGPGVRGLIDPETPQEAYTITSREGPDWELVFSDEVCSVLSLPFARVALRRTLDLSPAWAVPRCSSTPMEGLSTLVRSPYLPSVQEAQTRTDLLALTSFSAFLFRQATIPSGRPSTCMLGERTISNGTTLVKPRPRTASSSSRSIRRRRTTLTTSVLLSRPGTRFVGLLLLKWCGFSHLCRY
jgi:hypothetical protein